MVCFHIVYLIVAIACIPWWEGLMKRNWNAQNFCVSYKNYTFACVHGRYLLYYNFPNGARQTKRYFNVSTPSSRRDRNMVLKVNYFFFSNTISKILNKVFNCSNIWVEKNKIRSSTRLGIRTSFIPYWHKWPTWRYNFHM